MAVVPFPNYEPDKSIFDGNNTDVVANVLPVEGGWGPMKAHVPEGTALASECKGGIACVDTTGAAHIFVGTTTHLYKWNTGTMDFDDVSTAATTYTVPGQEFWSFHQFGDFLLATNGSDGLYYFDLTNGTEFVNASNAPVAKYVSNVGEYVLLLHVDNVPNRVQWSEIGSITDWTIGDAGAGRQDLPDGGEAVGATFGEEAVYILQDSAIRQAIYIGGSYTFQFKKVNTARGCKAPYAIVQAGNTFFYLDEDGIYEGPNGNPIGAEKVNRTLIGDYDLDLWDNVVGAADPTNKIVWWIMTPASGDKEMIGYDWQLNRWTRSTETMDFIFPAISPAYTLEGLANISASIDALPYSLDSRAYSGGRQALAGVDTDNKYGLFEGSNLAATVETNDLKLGAENQRAFCNGYRFITDADQHTGQVSGKATHSSAISFSPVVSPVASTGLITARSNARLHRFRANITAGDVWTYIHGLMPYVRAGGRR